MGHVVGHVKGFLLDRLGPINHHLGSFDSEQRPLVLSLWTQTQPKTVTDDQGVIYEILPNTNSRSRLTTSVPTLSYDYDQDVIDIFQDIQGALTPENFFLATLRKMDTYPIADFLADLSGQTPVNIMNKFAGQVEEINNNIVDRFKDARKSEDYDETFEIGQGERGIPQLAHTDRDNDIPDVELADIADTIGASVATRLTAPNFSDIPIMNTPVFPIYSKKYPIQKIIEAVQLARKIGTLRAAKRLKIPYSTLSTWMKVDRYNK